MPDRTWRPGHVARDRLLRARSPDNGRRSGLRRFVGAALRRHRREIQPAGHRGAPVPREPLSHVEPRSAGAAPRGGGAQSHLLEPSAGQGPVTATACLFRHVHRCMSSRTCPARGSLAPPPRPRSVSARRAPPAGLRDVPARRAATQTRSGGAHCSAAGHLGRDAGSVLRGCEPRQGFPAVVGRVPRAWRGSVAGLTGG